MLKLKKIVLTVVLCIATSTLLLLLMLSPSAYRVSREPEGVGLVSPATTETRKGKVSMTLTPPRTTLVLQSSRKPTRAPPARETTSSAINPGCISRKLDEYISVETEIVYNHPSIVQYAKLSSGPASLSFMEYMAMLSAYKLLKPERMIILTYTNITGKYWDLARKWKNTSVQLLKVGHVSSIGNKPFAPINHQADFIKLRSLLKFGGVISDFDVIVVNGSKLKHMQRISECVLSREGDYINAGFSSCIRNSSFIRKWLDTYSKDYRPHLWLHNSAFQPKYILENRTDVCHNVYLVGDIATDPTYAKAPEVWLKKNGVKWENKVAAHYFNRPMRLSDATVLDRGHSFGKMLRYIWDV